LFLSGKLFGLMAVAFLAYASISVFFIFVDHLQSLPIARSDYGVLIGVLAAVALTVRPVISSFFHSGNARGYLFLGAGLMASTLAAYSIADGFWSLLIVRIFHGVAFAVLGTALMTLLIEVIPPEKSAQFFGYFSVVTLLPNTLVPPILPYLNTCFGGFNRVLLFFSALILLVFPAIFTVKRQGSMKKKGSGSFGLSFREIVGNLTDGKVSRLLLSMLFLYSGHALVFFFLDGYGRSLGMANVGIFLTLCTGGEIAIRVIAGGLFDRLDKRHLAGWTLAALGGCYVLLSQHPGKWMFLTLGLLFGFGWGIIMPVFNGLMFDVSPAKFRAFNINFGLQMYQAGFFFGPMVGAPILAAWGYATLYLLCGAISVAASFLMFFKGRIGDGKSIG
jgi:predicted MFS family arabinose efflux permease